LVSSRTPSPKVPVSPAVTPPDILAPAGSADAFLAALAAGADAVYCGLKNFSARMEARNFDLDELARLTQLAHQQQVKVYVAFNALLTCDDLPRAGRLLQQLVQQVRPDALIIQDLGLIELVRQARFKGELHLSTLANVSFPAALKLVQQLKVHRVVLPRELSIDEIKSMARACPSLLSLESFIHGALCYGVSGRCYWSSFMGGKSGLRGRCVQPCRRIYGHQGKRKRLFACQDLSIDVLVKVLAEVSAVRTWKIEGRKKGPHYVYYTVTAYQMLRDRFRDVAAKKAAQQLLAQALGRPSTHYRFLPQRPYHPIDTGGQTGSGLLVGRVRGAPKRPYLSPRIELLTGDVLRLGYEDENRHTVLRVLRGVPKNGKYFLKWDTGRATPVGAPVFLVDRREKALAHRIETLREALAALPQSETQPAPVPLRLPDRVRGTPAAMEMLVHRQPPRQVASRPVGLWLSTAMLEAVSRQGLKRSWWWLPPVIWPADQERWAALMERLLAGGAHYFVLNAPWQLAFFQRPGRQQLWAGPFCNSTNSLSLNVLKQMGFDGVIVSPELGRQDYLTLAKQRPLPLGLVLGGLWPLCVSRILTEEITTGVPFSSPRQEEAWAQQHEDNYWIFPNWKLDLSHQRETLKKAGYSLFVHLREPVPAAVRLKKRPGLWNWALGLK
jgi:putative protease